METQRGEGREINPGVHISAKRPASNQFTGSGLDVRGKHLQRTSEWYQGYWGAMVPVLEILFSPGLVI